MIKCKYLSKTIEVKSMNKSRKGQIEIKSNFMSKRGNILKLEYLLNLRFT